MNKNIAMIIFMLLLVLAVTLIFNYSASILPAKDEQPLPVALNDKPLGAAQDA